MTVAEIEVIVSGRIDDLERKLDQGKKKVKGFADNVQSDIAKMAKEVGSLLASAFAIGALTKFGTEAVKAAASMDSMVRGLTTVMGSAKAANAELVKLKEVAKLPGLGFREAIQGSLNLQGAGMSAKVAREALMGFGNALATVGKGKAELDGVTVALSQMSAKGKVTAEELNQIAERYSGIRKVLKAAFGTADTEVLQKAGITFDEFIDRVNAQLKKLPRMSGGIQNDLENASDQFDESMREGGKALLPLVTAVLNRLIPALHSLTAWFKDLSKDTKSWIVGVGVALVALPPVISIIKAFATAFSVLRTGIRSAIAALADYIIKSKEAQVAGGALTAATTSGAAGAGASLLSRIAMGAMTPLAVIGGALLPSSTGGKTSVEGAYSDTFSGQMAVKINEAFRKQGEAAAFQLLDGFRKQKDWDRMRVELLKMPQIADILGKYNDHLNVSAITATQKRDAEDEKRKDAAIRAKIAAAQTGDAQKEAVKAWKDQLKEIGKEMKLHVSSENRPHAKTLTGNTSYHAVGKALDFAGTKQDMDAFFNFIREHYKGKINELIYGPLGAVYGRKSGEVFQTPDQMNQKIRRQHDGKNRHVHVALKGALDVDSLQDMREHVEGYEALSKAIEEARKQLALAGNDSESAALKYAMEHGQISKSNMALAQKALQLMLVKEKAEKTREAEKNWTEELRNQWVAIQSVNAATNEQKAVIETTIGAKRDLTDAHKREYVENARRLDQANALKQMRDDELQKVKDSTSAIRDKIRALQEEQHAFEMGLDRPKELTAVEQVKFDMRPGGQYANAGVWDRIAALVAAQKRDVAKKIKEDKEAFIDFWKWSMEEEDRTIKEINDAWDEQQGRKEEDFNRYMQNLSDRLTLVGDASETTRLRIELLKTSFGSDWEKVDKILSETLRVERLEAFKKGVQDLRDQFTNGFANMLDNLIQNHFQRAWSTIKQGFVGLFADIAREWLVLQAKMLLNRALTGLFSALMGGAGGGKGAGVEGFNPGIQVRASGGPVLDHNTYLVGEHGPEIITMNGNGRVSTAAETRKMMGGGHTVNVNVVSPNADTFLGKPTQDQIAMKMGLAFQQAIRRTA